MDRTHVGFEALKAIRSCTALLFALTKSSTPLCSICNAQTRAYTQTGISKRDRVHRISSPGRPVLTYALRKFAFQQPALVLKSGRIAVQ